MVFFEHARPSVESMANIVTVEHRTLDTASGKHVIDHISQGALPRPAETGEPDHTAAVAVQALALFTRDPMFVPSDVGIARHRKESRCKGISPLLMASDPVK
jgi:hypothetical protein